MEETAEPLDDNLRIELEKCLEKLTMSGKATLDQDVMKQFKRICKKSNVYVRHAFHALMIQLEKNHAEVRLSTFQMINELFNRSHEFRELLISQFQDFMELTVETNHDRPLPPPKVIAQKLKCETLKAVQQWHEKFGDGYKKLSLGYHYLRTCKKVDFNDIRSRTIAERRRSEEKERKKQALMKVRLDRILQEIEETLPEVENSVTEVENGLELILPAPDNFFICDTDEDNEPSSSKMTNKEKKAALKSNKSVCESEPSTSTSLSNRQSNVCDSLNEYSNSSGSRTMKNDSGSSSSNKLTTIKEKVEQECSNDEDINLSQTSNEKFKSVSDKDGDKADCDEGDDDDDDDDDEGDDDQSNKHPTRKSDDDKDKTDQDGDDDDDSDDDDDDDDFEEVPDNDGVVQSHGLGSHQYSIDIDMRQVGACVQESEDNRDIFNTIKDNICVIAIKYIPLTGQWLDILSKNGGSESDIKKIIDLKNKLLNVKNKCDELQVIPSVNVGKKRRSSDSDEDSDFEEVPEKEGYEPHIPAHLRAEYGLDTLKESAEDRKKAPERFMAQITPQYWSLSTISSLTDKHDPASLRTNLERARKKTKPISTVTSSSSLAQMSPSREATPAKPGGSREKTSAVPVVPFGLDLAFWENPEKAEAPMILKNDSLHRWWKPPECENETPSNYDMAALKNRAFHFTGTFEPVKWKCRAPLPNGSLCERMDRYKCPFHGKVIPRDDLGRPSSLNDALEMAKKAEKEAEDKVPDWQDPALLQDIKAATGLDLKIKGKGKGKGKGRKKKNSDLTDIEKIKNTSRSRLERKVFSKTAMKRVTSSLNAMDYRRIRDKFGNQFNYSVAQ